MQIISTIGSLSGKLGGAVGSHGRIGQQLVARRPRTQPRTTSQQVNRSKLPALASAWRQLTRAQQAGWAALASQTDSHDRLGQAHHPSAYTLFLSCNRNLQSIGASDILTDAPIKPSLPAIQNFTASALYDPLSNTPLLSGFTLSYQLAAASPAWGLLKATPTVSLGRGNIRPTEYRRLESFPAATPNTLTVNTLWTKLFGTFATSGQIAFMLKLVDPNSGFAGPAVTARADYAQAAQPTQPAGTIGIYVNPNLVSFAPIGEIEVGPDLVATASE